MAEDELLVQIKGDEIDQFPDFNDLIGMEYEKSILCSSIPFEMVEDIDLDKIMELPVVRYYLLCGPDGSGKHTLSNAYAKELQKKGYLIYRLYGRDLIKEENPKKKLEAIMDSVSRNENVVVLIDDFDQLCSEEDVLDELISWILGFADYGSGMAELVMCGISDEMNKIPLEVRKYFCVLELENPESVDRQNYFQKKLTFQVENSKKEKLKFMPVEGKSQQVFLANETEEFSYLDLEKLVMLIKLHFSQKINEATFGDASQIFEEIKHEEHYVPKEIIKKMVSRIRKEKVKEQELVNVQNAVPAPQIVMVGGQMPMGDSYMNYSPQNVQGTNHKRRASRDENICDIRHFEFLAERDGEDAVNHGTTGNSKIESEKETIDNPPAYKTCKELEN